MGVVHIIHILIVYITYVGHLLVCYSCLPFYSVYSVLYYLSTICDLPWQRMRLSAGCLARIIGTARYTL